MSKPKIKIANMFLLKTAQDQIKEKITDAKPPEQQVAIVLFLYGCTEQAFSNMRKHLAIAEPQYLKILNHLRDEWRKVNKLW